MERVCVIDRDIINILHSLKGVEPVIKINNCLITVDSDRYDNFYAHGFVCAKCGLEATYAAIERTTGSKKYHINFYGTRNDGREIVFTKDHIFPKSLGGFDSVNNYQVLCACCNGNKGDTTNLTIEEAVAKGYTSYERASIMKKLNEEKELLQRLNKLVSEKAKLISRLTIQARKINPIEKTTEFQ